MFDWLRRHAPAAPLSPVPRPSRERPASAGEYQPLHKYLRDRYANRLVMTFAEIEDLLGFSLPGGARLNDAWWAAPAGLGPAHAAAWTLAGRTATVNRLAQIVVFEREDGV
jgi:hypothetical protein